VLYDVFCRVINVDFERRKRERFHRVRAHFKWVIMKKKMKKKMYNTIVKDEIQNERENKNHGGKTTLINFLNGKRVNDGRLRTLRRSDFIVYTEKAVTFKHGYF